ncbi:PAS domain S-box protein [Spirosoma sp. KUDC1026]|uniref:PAS domain S-box protein n=1 Tax=Spirosoma sp. KUDC1026 TaxID=2745947 RepID=UPI00159BCD48|nr:PAS domain S-box protein [Spirosoma sp. KUDC1026]QKZ14073.1 PAS domain-containing protein [Spirosoma sp. KUDC1026]
MTGEQKPFENKGLNERLDIDFALKSARLGVWELDPATNLVIWDDRCRELFGLRVDKPLPYEQTIRHVHPDDIDRVEAAVAWAMNPASGGGYDVTYRTTAENDRDQRWVRVYGQGYFSGSGAILRFAGVAQDVTKDVRIQQQLADSERRFRSLIEQAPVATCLLVGPDMRIDVANETMLRYWGKDASVLGKPLLEGLPELADQPFPNILAEVYATGKSYAATQDRADLVVDGQLTPFYFNFTYKPLFNEQGDVYAIMNMAVDVTEQVMSQQELEERELYLQTIIEHSPVPKMVFLGEDMIINRVNEKMLDILGRDGRAVLGKPFMEAVPELKHTSLMTILRQVYTTGETYTNPEGHFELIRNGETYAGVYNFTFKPLRRTSGEIYGIINTAIEITDGVRARQRLEVSEAKLRSIISTAPAAMGLFVGRDLIVELPNHAFIDIVGKGPDIVGKPLREVMPELNSQPFLQILDDVYTTGKMYQSFNTQVDIVQHGVMTHNFYNITYSPLFDEQGNVYAVLDIAIDVTGEVKARQQIADTEKALRGAVELAELATWSMDIKTGQFQYSDRFKEWLGFTEETQPLTEVFNPLPEEDRQRVAEQLQAVVRPGSSGFYENEHPVINQRTGQRRIIHAQAQVFYDDEGNPRTLSGTAQDVTEQREIQLALEHLVQERTEELEAMNEEMTTTNEEIAAANEELAAINEELEKANQLLIRSNDNLQQFAYVASHDLQEPLRKVQQFGDLLKTRYAGQLGDGIDYLNRMQSAASRMSALIRDLLTFSRISNSQNNSILVGLNQVVSGVLTDLDLRIQETKAIVHADALPVVQGDPSQLGQLFQNLISNALKFQQPGSIPEIWVSARRVNASDLPTGARPTRSSAAYHQIDVVDNGIGFDEKYVDRIFQVFQRLHGKNEFVGTGIGLAICEKVAANHGGAITASSKPGEGATFSIFMPA